MLSAVLESLLGLVLLLLFLGKFIKTGLLLKVNEIWVSLGLKANFINKWWFNLLFLGFTFGLIATPFIESKASKLGVERGEYSKLESEGRLYGLSAEQYLEEVKKAKESGFDNTAGFIESKKMGIDNAVDYANAKKLGAKNKFELLGHMEEMKKFGTNSIDQYIEIVSKELQVKNAKKASEQSDRDMWILRCKKWAESKDSCAVAPNARKCIDIKMGEGEAGMAAIYCQGPEPQWGLMGKR